MSQDFTQDELKRLAEIAGVKKVPNRENYMFETFTNGKDIYIGWQPDKDLNQAEEILIKGFRGHEILIWRSGNITIFLTVPKMMYCEERRQDIEVVNRFKFCYRDVTKAVAICKAVLEAKK